MKKQNNISFITLTLLLILCCNSIFFTSCMSSNSSSDYYEDEESYDEEYDEDEIDLNDINMFPVDSSCFSYVGYDYDQKVLLVEFRSEPDYFYAYFDFPNDEYNSFIDSDSLGGYYNDYIKGYYECEKFEY